MLITPEIIAAAKAASKDRPGIQNVYIEDARACGCDGKIAVIATYEPQLESPDAPVLLNAKEFLHAVDGAGDAQLIANGDTLVIRTNTVAIHFTESTEPYPGVFSILRPTSKPIAKFNASISILQRLLKALAVTTGREHDFLEIALYASTGEHPNWPHLTAEVHTPKTPGSRVVGFASLVTNLDAPDNDTTLYTDLPETPTETSEPDDETPDMLTLDYQPAALPAPQILDIEPEPQDPEEIDIEEDEEDDDYPGPLPENLIHNPSVWNITLSHLAKLIKKTEYINWIKNLEYLGETLDSPRTIYLATEDPVAVDFVQKNYGDYIRNCHPALKLNIRVQTPEA